jgi:hypothetical protein
MCTMISFISAALAQTQALCYPAIASGSVVLILPVRPLFLVIFSRLLFCTGLSLPHRLA